MKFTLKYDDYYHHWVDSVDKTFTLCQDVLTQLGLESGNSYTLEVRKSRAKGFRKIAFTRPNFYWRWKIRAITLTSANIFLGSADSYINKLLTEGEGALYFKFTKI